MAKRKSFVICIRRGHYADWNKSEKDPFTFLLTIIHISIRNHHYGQNTLGWSLNVVYCCRDG